MADYITIFPSEWLVNWNCRKTIVAFFHFLKININLPCHSMLIKESKVKFLFNACIEFVAFIWLSFKIQ